MPKVHALIRIGVRTKRQAAAIADALRPEAAHPTGNKASARVVTKGRQLTIGLEAKDTATLRAIMNSYLRMLAASLNALFQLEQLQVSKKHYKHSDSRHISKRA